MTTWLHYPASHPWMPTLKRKHSDEDEDDHEGTPPPSCSPLLRRTQPKRPRFDLSRNLSQLSLEELHVETQPVIQEPQQPSPVTIQTSFEPDGVEISSTWTSSSSLLANMETDIPVYHGPQPVVEEPETAPPIPEVRMRHSSSYEPEKDRIVVTDLDSSEDERESVEGFSTAHDETYSVSPAVLARLKSSKTPISLKNVIPNSLSEDSRALVLFRPSPWSAQSTQQLNGYFRDRDERKPREENLAPPQIDEDAMEIE